MFRNIDFQIAEAQNQINEYISNGIDVQNIKHQYLRSLVLLIVSEYENIIEKIFYIRASKCNDTQIVNYVKNQIDKKFRSPDLSKINQTIGNFDDTLKQRYISIINNTPVNSAWDNIMKARHFIVHKQGTLNLTYEELISTYPNTKIVIRELVRLFNLSENEII